MVRRGGGKIINVCGIMSEVGRETAAASASAKGGLKMLTKNIASDTVLATFSATQSRRAIIGDGHERRDARETAGRLAESL